MVANAWNDESTANSGTVTVGDTQWSFAETGGWRNAEPSPNGLLDLPLADRSPKYRYGYVDEPEAT